MTDREVMQQALEALEATIDVPCYGGHPKQEAAAAALRAALAEPDHHDPIGDAQDKLIAEQVASHDYRTRYDRGCYKCGSHYCPADCPMPTHLVPQQPQMQPCAGRNCGSTNPNLHSAECFEDYEKTTGMNKWQGLTDEDMNDVMPYCHNEFDLNEFREFANNVAAILKEKNA